MGGVNCEPEYVILIPEVQLFMLILMVFQLQRVRVYCIIGLFVLTPSFAVSDYYQFDDLLTSEYRSIRKKVRGIMEKEIAPIMAEVC